NAYYYSFERTGVPEVDAILSALAWAGKGMHSTQNWSDAEYNFGYGPFDAGLSYVDVIQAAANEAAERIRSLAAAVPSTTEQEGAHDRDRDGICRRCGHGLNAAMILDGEKPCAVPSTTEQESDR